MFVIMPVPNGMVIFAKVGVGNIFINLTVF
jgi:hypothetical protein